MGKVVVGDRVVVKGKSLNKGVQSLSVNCVGVEVDRLQQLGAKRNQVLDLVHKSGEGRFEKYVQVHVFCGPMGEGFHQLEARGIGICNGLGLLFENLDVGKVEVGLTPLGVFFQRGSGEMSEVITFYFELVGSGVLFLEPKFPVFSILLASLHPSTFVLFVFIINFFHQNKYRTFFFHFLLTFAHIAAAPRMARNVHKNKNI